MNLSGQEIVVIIGILLVLIVVLRVWRSGSRRPD